MKKRLILLLFVLIGAVAHAQTLYAGKYRNLFYDLPMTCNKLCKYEVVVDSFVYAIRGFRDGDEFEVTCSCNRKTLMLQRFYMNGEKKLDDISVNDWFKGDFTLDYFLKTIFNYSVPARKK
jgi:hypothetical protein